MLNICYKFVTNLLRKILPVRFFQELDVSNYLAGIPEFTIYVKFYHKLEAGNFWKSWEKLEAWRAGNFWGGARVGQAGTVRRAGKICKILHKLETLRESNICINILQAGNLTSWNL